MTGLEWLAYSLLKEVVWDAVDTAFDMKEVSNWEEWDMAECDRVSNRRIQPEKSDDLQVIECGTAQSAIPVIGGGGGEKQKPKSNRPKKKNKLPGVSAHQKSVAEFFSKTTPKIISRWRGVGENRLKNAERGAQNHRITELFKSNFQKGYSKITICC